MQDIPSNYLLSILPKLAQAAAVSPGLIKVALYKLARQGEEVEREAKKVVVHSLELTRFDSPDAEITVECGSGTYVRTLAHDLGEVLGCGGYLSNLRRLQSQPFGIEVAHSFEACEEAARLGKMDDLLIPPEKGLGFPVIQLAAQGVSPGL